MCGWNAGKRGFNVEIFLTGTRMGGPRVGVGCGKKISSLFGEFQYRPEWDEIECGKPALFKK